jgi:hypothetical protein
MYSKRIIRRAIHLLVIVLLTVIILGMPVRGHAAPDHADGLQIYTNDVFVIVGSTLRHPDDTTASDAPLFNNAGVNLNLTWGQWKAAAATSTAHANGKRTDVRVQLSGLVPNGVYSIFYVTIGPDSENPLCPHVERALPLTAFKPDRQSPDASSFVADGSGKAEYRGQVDGDLFASTQLIVEVIYHSDGRTYHPLPNRGESLTQGSNCRSSYGEDAMRQLLILQTY